jgi:hypothetical protein
MCDNSKWQQQFFQTKSNMYGKILYRGSGDVQITGRVDGHVPGKTRVVFWAPNPPNYLTSYTGSALPFANTEMAYEETPNAGTVAVDAEGKFSFSIVYPNGYYTGLGTAYVSPHVQLQTIVGDSRGEVETVRVGEGIPFRLLTYPPVPATAPRCSPAFYENRGSLPAVRTQEQILRDSAYPDTNEMPANFWGLRPAS